MIKMMELWNRCAKLIEEYTGSAINPFDDEDITAKAAIATNQGILEICQKKPITRLALLEKSKAKRMDDFMLYECPADFSQLKKAYLKIAFDIIPDGELTYIKVPYGYKGNITIEYAAFPPEINSDSSLDTEIKLTPYAVNCLEYFICKELMYDDEDFYSKYLKMYQEALDKLETSTARKMAHFEYDEEDFCGLEF